MRGVIYGFALAFTAVGVLAPTAAQEKSDPNAISPRKASMQVGKKVKMKMPVRSTSVEVHHRLCNRQDPEAPESFWVVIHQEALPAFKKVNIDNPATFYKDKTIEVVGTVTMGAKHFRIVVDDPKNIKVIAD